MTEQEVSIGLAMTGTMISWGVWVSVSLFKHSQSIALIKQEVEIMKQIKGVLDDIHDDIRKNRRTLS